MQHELSKAVSGPMARKQRAAHSSVVKAEERLTRMHEHLNRAHDALDRRGPSHPPPSAARLALSQQEVDAARHESQREKVIHSIRAIGHAYHFVDLERGVRRNGKLIAGDIHAQIDRIRAIAQQEGLSQTCLERIEKAVRVVPKMQATIEFVSRYVRQHVQQLDLTQPESYAVHAHLIPSYYLERVTATRSIREGTPLRALAERLRTPLFAPGGALSNQGNLPAEPGGYLGY